MCASTWASRRADQTTASWRAGRPRRVYALDVGYGQLAHELRVDERVVVMERVNARYLPADAIPEPCDLVTIDVSFIGLGKIVPALLPASLLETDFALGCPIGNLALEMVDCGPEVRRRRAEDFELWARRIEGCLEAAADRLPADVDRGRLAGFVLAVMEGAVLLARGHRDIAPFDGAVAQLRDYFGRLAPTPNRKTDPRNGRKR